MGFHLSIRVAGINFGPRVGFAGSPLADTGSGGNDFLIRGRYDTVNVQPFLNNPFFNGGPSGARAKSRAR